VRSSYIERILRIEDGQGNARTLTESDLAGLSAPFILLGDPGLGKTKLTESLETRLKGKRLLGGTFVRTAMVMVETT
jgi:MoxR-like ATPase